MNAPVDIRADQALEQGFQLGDIRIEPLAGEVTGPGGREQLDPKVMDVLVFMARHAGRVVPREDLLTQLWPHAVVTDDALTRCFYELRRQLSHAGGDDRYKAMFETLPKRGYRLHAEVVPLSPELAPPAQAFPAAAARRRRFVAIGAAIVVALALSFFLAQRADDPATSSTSPGAAMISVAVLPFEDLSAAQDQGHFSDGVSEEILDRLDQIPNLLVIARTSSFSFRGQALSVSEIADELNVTHVLEGSVRRSGDRVRITTRLVEASSNSQLWTKTYDRERGDLFAIQDEIAASVATVLRLKLAASARGDKLPQNLEAHEQLLHGDFFYNRRGPGDVARAVRYYQQAIALEPDYARPWAALAGAYSLLGYEGEMPQYEALAKQGEAARKAVELDPGLAVAHARLSQYHWDIGDRRTGYEIWDRAKALDPDDPLCLNFTAGLAMRAGDFKTGIEAQQSLVARDPRSASYRANLGSYLLATDQFEEAKTQLREAQELNPNLGWRVDLAIARILILEKRLDEARKMIENLPDEEGRDHGFALLYHALGRRPEADALLARLEEESLGSPDIRLAEVYAYHGATERAFDALAGLQEAVDRDEPALVSQVWSWQLELQVSPFLKPLHDDPRWQALVDEPGPL